jgi:hypothetical protein
VALQEGSGTGSAGEVCGERKSPPGLATPGARLPLTKTASESQELLFARKTAGPAWAVPAVQWGIGLRAGIGFVSRSWLSDFPEPSRGSCWLSHAWVMKLRQSARTKRRRSGRGVYSSHCTPSKRELKRSCRTPFRRARSTHPLAMHARHQRCHPERSSVKDLHLRFCSLPPRSA